MTTFWQALKSAPSLSFCSDRTPVRPDGRCPYSHVVHSNRNAQHGAHGDQIRSDMSIGDCAMVSAPVVHYIICGVERASSPVDLGANQVQGHV